MDQGSCLNEDPEKFFPEGKGSVKKMTDEAKAICIGKCGVRLQCLARTLAQEKNSGDRFGVSGGMTPTERELLQKKLNEMQGASNG
ncbi:WhiB family transcription factor [Microbacterium phage Morrill]|nr:WhiB family transcription factor [Microbacterium phage Atraxi]UQT01692.1 WhiB family transcription factor [Microbacterium phage Morrill]